MIVISLIILNDQDEVSIKTLLSNNIRKYFWFTTKVTQNILKIILTLVMIKIVKVG